MNNQQTSNISVQNTEYDPYGDKALFQQELARVSPYAAALDPNWSAVRIANKNGKIAAWVNGPKEGDIALNVPLEALVDESCAARLTNTTGENWSITNPGHKFIPLVGKVVISFENCETGYIVSLNEDTSFNIVRSYEGLDKHHYTANEIESDLAIDAPGLMMGQTVEIYYCPFHYNLNCAFSTAFFKEGQQVMEAVKIFHEIIDSLPRVQTEQDRLALLRAVDDRLREEFPENQ
jgi:hypothetical protein